MGWGVVWWGGVWCDGVGCGVMGWGVVGRTGGGRESKEECTSNLQLTETGTRVNR